MSRKRRAGRAPSGKTTPGSPATGASAGDPGRPPQRRLVGWRKWVARLIMMVFIPTLLLLAIEVALRLAGYGYSTRFFARTEDGRAFTTNRKFGWQFMPRETATQPYPVTLPAHKQKDTLRVFILGESAAQGTPAPAFGFGRILEVMLQEQFPEQRFEFINAAMRGINSHAVRLIARECAGHEPDLFIIYMGNNEAVGFYAPEPGPFNLTTHPRLIRLVQWLKSMKLAQLFVNASRALRKAPPRREKQDMEFFRSRRFSADDPLRQAVIENFRANLAEILQVARESGARVILSTVGVNLLDFPPLGSLHRPGLSAEEMSRWETAYQEGIAEEARGNIAQAIQHYEAAARLDDHFAELHFRLARGLLAGGNAEQSRRHFRLACDWDALQFRSDSRVNEVIRKAQTAGRWIHPADAEGAFALAATNEHNIPGHRFFYEHVHLNFDGDYLTARTLLPAVVSALNLTNAPARPIPSREECAAALAFSSWDELGTRAAMVRLTANPPFLDQLEHGQRQARAEGEIAERTRRFMQEEPRREAIAVYRAALTRRADDWQIHLNFGNLWNDFGLFGQAADEFARVVKAQPDFLPARLLLGHALRQSGRPAEAVAQFEEVLKREPGQAAARAAMAETFRTRR